mgnify:CR=1 FL=1
MKMPSFCLQWMQFRLSTVSDGKGYLFEVLNSIHSTDPAITTLRFDSNKIGAQNAATVFWSSVTYAKEAGNIAPPFFERLHYNIVWKNNIVMRFHDSVGYERAVKKIAYMLFNTPFGYIQVEDVLG